MINIIKPIFGSFAAFLLTSLPLIASETESAEKAANPVSISGTISAEASNQEIDYKDKAADDAEGSTVLGEVNLFFDAVIEKYLNGHVGLKWEEAAQDTDGLMLDEGYLQLGGNLSFPLYLKTGKMYVPFGKFYSRMISDPLTLEISETRETAAEAGISYAGFNLSFYAFNGKINLKDKDDKIDNFGSSAGYAFSNDIVRIELGGGYINNLMDSDGLRDITLAEEEEAESIGYSTRLSDHVPGITAYAFFKLYGFYISGEYAAMIGDVETYLEDITPGTLASLGLGNTAKTDGFKAWNIEAGCSFNIVGRETTVCIGYQGVKNSGELFPEKRYIGTAGMKLMNNLYSAVEYAYDKYENGDKGNTLTGKLEIAF